MKPFRPWLDRRLASEREAGSADSRHRLHASLALLPVDRGQVGYLIDRMLEADPETLEVIRDALATAPGRDDARFWAVLEDPRARNSRRLRAASALAAYQPDSPRWRKVAPDVVTMLSAENLISVARWGELLRPVRGELLSPLHATFLEQRGKERSSVSALLLAEYVDNRSDLMADLILDADPRQLRLLAAKLPKDGGPVLATLRAVLAGRREAKASPGIAPDPAQSRANAALTLMSLGRSEEFWPLLAHREDPGNPALPGLADRPVRHRPRRARPTGSPPARLAAPRRVDRRRTRHLRAVRLSVDH